MMLDMEGKLVYLEVRLPGGEWARHPRHSLALHPAYAPGLLRDLKRVHKSQEFRLVEVKDEDIPF